MKERPKTVKHKTPTTEVILGNQTVGALLDSGATNSFLTKEMIDKCKPHKFKEIEIQGTFVTANGEIVNTTTAVKTWMKIGTFSWNHTFVVYDQLPVPMILGVDFMFATGLTLDFTGGNFSFKFNPDTIFPMLKLRAEQEHMDTQEAKIAETLKTEHLTLSRQRDFAKIVSEYPDVITDKLGSTNMIEYKIELTDNIPVRSPVYNCTPPKLEAIKTQINEMLRDGTITPSTSNYASSCFLVPKPNGEQRLVIDYRKLNRKVKFDGFPLPSAELAFMYLKDAKYFTVLDLNKSYFQVPLDKASRECTAFVTPVGLFEFKYLPMGISIGGQILSRLMDTLFQDIKYKFLLTYVDDLLLFSKDYNTHLENVREVLNRLRNAGFTVKPSKISFAHQQIKFLGHLISEGQIMTDPDKTVAINRYPTPKNLKQLKTWIGMCAYYAKFIEGFAKLVAPLNYLRKKNVRFIWGVEQEEAFQKLKKALSEPPTLHIPDFEKEFVLQTDASDIGISAILSQYHGTALAPIGYASRSLTVGERKTSIFDREGLAVIYGIEKFAKYLEGRKFQLQVDNSAVTYILNNGNQMGKLGRWALKLNRVQYYVVHIPSARNAAADALSRSFEISEQADKACVLQNIPESFISIRNHQETDADCVKLREEIAKNEQPHFKLHDGVIWYKPQGVHRKRVLIPQKLQPMILQYYHNTSVGIHQGIRKTYHRIKRDCYWKGMYNDVLKHVQCCADCQFGKPTGNAQFGKHAAEITEKPWEKIFIDYVGPLIRTSAGNNGIFVAVDAFSKFVFIHPVRNMTAQTTVKVLKERIFSTAGIPQVIVSDNASIFRSQIFHEMCFGLGIEHRHMTPYRPHASVAERVNRNIKSALTILHHQSQKKWDTHLGELALALNTSIHEATMQTPAALFLGRELRHPLSNMWKLDEDIWTEDDIPKLEERWAQALKNLESARKKAAQKYNKGRTDSPLKEGDLVLCRLYPQSSAADGQSSKIMRKWQGALKIARFTSRVTVDLCDPQTLKFVRKAHVAQLKRFYTR